MCQVLCLYTFALRRYSVRSKGGQLYAPQRLLLLLLLLLLLPATAIGAVGRPNFCPALMGQISGGQGRHHVVTLKKVCCGVYCAQRTEARAEEAGAPQQDVCRGVALLAADQAEARRAAGVAALGALDGGSAADSVQVLLRAAPVARPELVHVHRLLSWCGQDRPRGPVRHH